MVVKILELIYFKSVTQEQRDRDLLGVDKDKPLELIEDTPEVIASEYLDPVADRML